MADLDEISVTLGKLLEGQSYAREWFEKHEEADQKRFRELSVSIERANGYSQRIIKVEHELARVTPVAEGINRFKWGFIGVLFVGGLVGGAHITAVVTYLIHIMG